MMKKYIKAVVKDFNGVVNTNIWGNNVPNRGVHHTSIACIGTDSVMKMKIEMEKKNYPQVYSEEYNYKIKKKKILGFIDVELELDSGFDSEYFTRMFQ